MPELTLNILLTVWIAALLVGCICFYIPHPKAQKLSMALGGVAFIGMPFLIGFIWLMFNIWR